jgi:hypothetical protein
MCGTPLAAAAESQLVEHRWIFIDLKDLGLPGYVGEPASRAAVTAYVYERFTPFADDGWEFTVFPGNAAFDGWAYEHVDGRLSIVGAHLLCKRAAAARRIWMDRPHHVSEQRARQLTGFEWTSEPGSKILRREAKHNA